MDELEKKIAELEEKESDLDAPGAQMRYRSVYIKPPDGFWV
jgi:hypothetical protein